MAAVLVLFGIDVVLGSVFFGGACGGGCNLGASPPRFRFFVFVFPFLVSSDVFLF